MADARTPSFWLELRSAEALLSLARELRAEGYAVLDAHTPFPVDGVAETLDLRPSPIPWVVLGGACCGGGLAYLVQWFLNAVEYRLDVGGRPFHPWPAFVPITYEMATLFAALCGFFAFFFLTGLPRLWHPAFEVKGIETMARDRFWLHVAAPQDARRRAELRARLRERGVLHDDDDDEHQEVSP